MRKFLLAAAFGLVSMASARADLVMTFNNAGVFSGDPMGGSLTATFHTVSTGVVDLTLNSALSGSENLDPGAALYLNLDPSIPIGTMAAKVTSDPFGLGGTWAFATDAYKPDGDGLMDAKLTYAAATKALTNGQSEVFEFTGRG